MKRKEREAKAYTKRKLEQGLLPEHDIQVYMAFQAGWDACKYYMEKGKEV